MVDEIRAFRGPPRSESPEPSRGPRSKCYKLHLADGQIRFLDLERDDDKILIELPFASPQKLAQNLERLWDALDILLWESTVRVKDNHDPWKSEFQYKIDGKTFARVYQNRGTLIKVIICSGSVPIEVVA